MGGAELGVAGVPVGGVPAGQLGQRAGAGGAVAAAVLPLAAAVLALGGAAGASLAVEVEQLHPLDLAAVVAALGQHRRPPSPCCGCGPAWRARWTSPRTTRKVGVSYQWHSQSMVGGRTRRA